MTTQLYPLTFQPLYKERVWGGRNLERRYGRELPAERVIGESWEICDRPEDQSVVANGALAGRTLESLIAQYPEALMGQASLWEGRFPLLVKILDAQQKLSLQVHPPAGVADQLKGDPKTEMWFLADCEPGADLFVGLRQGVAREAFETAVKQGGVADCFHRIEVEPGTAMFLPSGRVHAIGAGNLIFEIQQNSDTTYRVHDWDRLGLDGKPRDLHVAESLQSIDFDDFEPDLVRPDFEATDSGVERQMLADCELFRVERWRIEASGRVEWDPGDAPRVLGVAEGSLCCETVNGTVTLGAGDFCLVPAGLGGTLRADHGRVDFLLAQPRAMGR